MLGVLLIIFWLISPIDRKSRLTLTWLPDMQVEGEKNSFGLGRHSCYTPFLVIWIYKNVGWLPNVCVCLIML